METSPVERTALRPASARGFSKQKVTPWLVGAGAVLGLMAFYLGTVSLLQGTEHTLSLLWQDRFFVVPIALGFGTQWGLYSLLRQRRSQLRSSTAMAATGTGTSTISMVACCLHHTTDVLPFLGLGGAALFLAQFRTPLLVLALGMNLAGAGWMAWLLRQQQQARCH